MKRWSVLLPALVVVVSWTAPQAAPGADYKTEYKLSTVVGKPFPWGIAGERWAELVKEKTAGRIQEGSRPSGRQHDQGGGDQRGQHREAHGC